jgi:threonylcarbamoyladenosine tRNA methylthiotransferase MtaB
MQIKNKSFCIITLGCRTNICETDVLSSQLIKASATKVKEIRDANICIINTCCVTAKAEHKSKYYINQAIRSQKTKLVIVIGCLAQMAYKTFEHPKIGIVLGNQEKNNLVDYIRLYKTNSPIIQVSNFKSNDAFQNYDYTNTIDKTRAFIKIQDGCNFMCSYCVIPFVRGRQRSLASHKILSIINKLVSNNCKEIVLTGVNTAGYYENKNYGFYKLLKSINELKGNFRVRISSLEPFQINKKIINLLTNNQQRWCQHFHICLQSGCNRVLKQMKRKYTVTSFLKLCKYIRSKNKFASITTDCIVGFPSETDNDFKISRQNFNKIQFADIHIFPFSARPFTTANKLPIIINDYEKRQRFMEMKKIRDICQRKYLNKFVGRTVQVLFEKSTDPH